jgi:hypothetical protein
MIKANVAQRGNLNLKLAENCSRRGVGFNQNLFHKRYISLLLEREIIAPLIQEITLFMGSEISVSFKIAENNIWA